MFKPSAPEYFWLTVPSVIGSFNLALHRESCQLEAAHAHAGAIDREKLGDLVFTDSNARKKLNKATHLPVALELARQLVKEWLSFTSIVVRSISLPVLLYSCLMACTVTAGS